MVGRQAKIFLVVGLATVLIDYVVYSMMVSLGAGIMISKAIGFMSGTVFSYFSNKHWTFESAISKKNDFIAFGALYALALALNIISNNIVIYFVGYLQTGMLIAFFIATGLSAVLNFLGMKFWVFRSKHEAAL